MPETLSSEEFKARVCEVVGEVYANDEAKAERIEASLRTQDMPAQTSHIWMSITKYYKRKASGVLDKEEEAKQEPEKEDPIQKVKELEGKLENFEQILSNQNVEAILK